MVKGISPIISAVMLIAIVMVVGTMTLDWGAGIQTLLGSKIENKTTDCTTASVTIEQVYLAVSEQTGRIVVRNSGFDADTVASVSIVNTKGVTGGILNSSHLPSSLAKGGQTTLVINITDVITTCTNFSRAFVATECGLSAEYGTVGQTPICT
tara:strand:- start:200 stop:658 length:459 start_codon:yes stop_codon:yes gene_type:complete